MGKADAKGALKTAQTGTLVPEKDFSSKKKEAKADKGGKGGSLSKVASLPMPTATDTPAAKEPSKWEGSSEDWSKDYSEAKKRGMTTEQYEDTASDRVSDKAGEKRMREKDAHEGEVHASGYKAGVAAFSNSPKTSHGFGHPSFARDGHLRNSGHHGAHRIGKKK